MKLPNITENHIAAICFVLAGIVAATGNDGWGWLLLVGAMLVL